MVSAIEIYPQAAAAAGCAASWSVDHTNERHDAMIDSVETFYNLSATAAAGWHFDHFEWTQTRSDGADKSGNSSSNPATNSTSLYDATYDWSAMYEQYGFVDSTYSVNYCRAVFEEDVSYGDITVETSADPAAGGTTTPVSETHQYSGSASTTFTLTATANPGYRFWRWERDGYVAGGITPLTVTHYFTQSAQTFHYVAKFVPSDAILYGSSGAIIHGASGAILHGG